MSNEPLKITVVTVTYNAGAVLERTLRSVEQQDYPHVEHLIVDGNSQDNTLELFHHYQERNSRARVRHEVVAISEPDGGLYDAMNKGIQLATGNYLCFLNAGDKLHDARTLTRLAQLAQSRPAVIYGDTDIVDEAGNRLRPRRLRPPRRLTWRSFRHGMLVCHQAFYVRADLARETRYDQRYRYSADFDWCIRILHKAQLRRLPVENAGAVLADYLNEGMTTRNHSHSLRERFRIMVHHYGWVSTVVMHLWFVLRSVLKK